MSLLAQLLKSTAPPANVANSANLNSQHHKDSQLSQDSQQSPVNFALPVQLEMRIRTMAKRWRYTDEDLVEVLALAKADPHGWLLTVNSDERRFGTGTEWPLQ